MPAVRSVSLGIWADVGSAAERPPQRGISHLVEHMLFKGTSRRSAREIAETMDGVGGNLNAFTDKETTCYYAKVIDTHVPLALDVLADMFVHSTFDPGELAKEQKVVLEEIRMYDDSPDDMVHDVFTRTMWARSSLGEPTIGYTETISALASDDLRAHMAERYAPNTVVVTAAGNVDHDAFVALVDAALADFRGAGSVLPAVVPDATPATVVRRKDTEQAYAMLGVRGLAVDDPRRFTLSVADVVLGGGMSSRLFQEVREKRGLAYSVYSFQQSYRGGGLFGVSAGIAPASAQECVDVVIAELARFANEGPTEAETALAREHLKGALALSLESSSSRMMRLGRSEFDLAERLEIDEVERRIDAVERDAVHALARELITPQALGVCILGPLDDVRVSWPS